MNPLMLCVRMEPVRLMRISLIAAKLGIAVKEVKEEEYGQRIEALCGLKEAAPAPGRAEIGEEMAVLAFFPGGLLDELYSAIRKNGMNPPRLTAVLTPTNRAWTLDRLCRELQTEAAAMGRRK